MRHMATLKKMAYTVALSLFLPLVATAAHDTCDTAKAVLTCETTYQLNDGAIVVGPKDTGATVDLEVEPYDPSVCTNSVKLLTYAGRFLAVYNHQDGTFQALLESNGQTSVLVDSGTVLNPTGVINISTPSPFLGVVYLIHFKCVLK